VYFLLFIFIIILNTPLVLAQNSTIAEKKEEKTNWRDSAVKIFLDVSHLVYPYEPYIKTEIPFINFVRDARLAQVYILITHQPTGGGGTEYTFTILDQKEFSNKSDTLKYISEPASTFEMRRSEMVRVLKMGLMRYVVKTPLADDINIIFNRKIKPSDAIAVNDNWNYWVFTVRMNGEVKEEKFRKAYKLNGSFSARRETPDWKIRLNGYNNMTRDKWIYDDEWRNSESISRGANVLIVKSLSEHWSIGGYGTAAKAPYYNTKLYLNIAPAVEFNLFPYSQSTRREFRFLYKIGYSDTKYDEVTIYDKLHEQYFNETLSATFEMKERWGSITAKLEGAHNFPHSGSKNFFKDLLKEKHLNLSGRMSFRVIEGLSLTLFGSYSIIRDQLYLQKGDLPEYQILLQRKSLATDYELRFNLGFSYTFGSIYSNVVNPRFGG